MGASSGALYRVGTVNLVNGNPAIVGVGTSWLSALIAVAIGDLFTLDMKTWYEIISVDDDNNIVLDRGFEGTTANTTNYGIVRNTSGTVLTRIAGQIAVQFNQKQLFLDELRTWLNSTNATENVTDSHGLAHSITTPSQIEADAQTFKDDGDAILAATLETANNLTGSMMATTKSEFFALAEKRIRDGAGSGNVFLGGITEVASTNGINCLSTIPNENIIEENKVVVNGVQHKLAYINAAISDSDILFPDAPDGTKTYDSATGLVVEHASAAEAFEGLVTNGDFRSGDTTGWTTQSDNTFSVTDGICTAVTATAVGIRVGNDIPTVVDGDTIKIRARVRSSLSSTLTVFLSDTRAAYGGRPQAQYGNVVADEWFTLEAELTADSTYVYDTVGISIGGSEAATLDVDYVEVLPVTESVITSRKDYVFLESFHEKINDKDVVYPLGNVQYGASTWEGITLSNTVVAQGYSAFGAWDADTKGYGVVWSTLSAADKVKFVQDAENNIYSDDGVLIQVRYRIRVIEGLGDEWANVTPESGGVMRYTNDSEMSVKARGLSTTFTDLATGGDGVTFYSLDQAGNISNISGTWALHQNVGNISHGKGMVFAVPIALVQRRNQGAYSPVHNPNGCRGIRLNSTRHWYNAEAQITSTQVCFTKNVTGTVNGYNVGTGAIGQGFYRPDDKFYDAIYASDVQDLRMSSKRLPLTEIREKYKRMAIAGEVRGFEGVPFTNVLVNTKAAVSTPTYALGLTIYDTTSISVGDKGWILAFDATTWQRVVVTVIYGSTTLDVEGSIGQLITRDLDTYFIHETPNTHYQANPTWTDIIGDPANIAATFPNGVEGQWIPQVPDGSQADYLLNRKATNTVMYLNTADYGSIWREGNLTFNSTQNALLNYNSPLTRVSLWHYETQAHFTSDDVNSEVLDMGGVYVTSSFELVNGSLLSSSIIGKVGTFSFGGSLESENLGAVWGYVYLEDSLNIVAQGAPTHRVPNAINLSGNTSKTLDYLSSENNVAKLNYAYKEMVYDVDWGDNNQFEITNNQATQTDDNGNTIKYGTASFNTQYFIVEE